MFGAEFCNYNRQSKDQRKKQRENKSTIGDNGAVPSVEQGVGNDVKQNKNYRRRIATDPSSKSVKMFDEQNRRGQSEQKNELVVADRFETAFRQTLQSVC